MKLQRLYQRLVNRPRTGRQVRPQTGRRPGIRLGLEQLEDRLVPSNFTAANVSELIADINAANLAGGSNTIALTAPTSAPYTLTAVDNTADGATGLPVIAKNDRLSIVGNGDAIARDTSGGFFFRLFDVAKGASLTLENLTLQGGRIDGTIGKGGAILNQGTLDLNGVTVQNNRALGLQPEGGGIYSSGTLILEGGTVIQNNTAGTRITSKGFGGGIYMSGGTATIINVTLASNSAFAQGPGRAFGGDVWVGAGHGVGGGVAEGGAIYAAGGTITMRDDNVTGNIAYGLYIAPTATVYLDAFTLANIVNNTAGDIYGSYTIIS